MLKAMPSPSGTNYEGLYIPDRGPSAAYDSADPDDNGENSGAPMSATAAMKIQEFCKGKLSGSDLSALVQLLESLSGAGFSADEDAETEEERKERLAKRGNELDGSYSLSMDARMTGGARMAGGNGLEARAVGGKRVNTARAEAEFRKLFPSAGKLSR